MKIVKNTRKFSPLPCKAVTLFFDFSLSFSICLCFSLLSLGDSLSLSFSLDDFISLSLLFYHLTSVAICVAMHFFQFISFSFGRYLSTWALFHLYFRATQYYLLYTPKSSKTDVFTYTIRNSNGIKQCVQGRNSYAIDTGKPCAIYFLPFTLSFFSSVNNKKWVKMQL